MQVRESGDLLRLPYQAIASALVFLHRFMQGNNEPYLETVSTFSNAVLKGGLTRNSY